MDSKNNQSNKGRVLALLAVCILLVLGIFIYSIRNHDKRKAKEMPQESPKQESAEMTPEPEGAGLEGLSPELFQEKILVPPLAYHPGTAGSSLQAAGASATILRFITDIHLHLEEQDRVNSLMANAAALITEDERKQLEETLPGLCSLIDETLVVYPENRGLYEDAGSEEAADTALAVPGAAEDWARTKTALETVFTSQ